MSLTIDNRNLTEMSEFQLDRIKALQGRVKELEAKVADGEVALDKAQRIILSQDLQIAELLGGTGA